MSISERFFVIGEGPEMVKMKAEPQRRDSEMEDTQTERTANFAAADANVLGMLLSEILDALKARNLLSELDIAGALLRAEYRAEMADKFNEEDEGDISGHHVAAAQLTVESWERRLSLKPSLYILRKQQMDWISDGQHGESPLAPDEILRNYPDEDHD